MWWALGWLALMQFLERVAEPWFAQNLVAQLDAQGSSRAKALWRAVTASAFLLSWAPAWHLGGDSAAFFAAAMMSGALINALVYFSNEPLTFYAAVAPPIVAAVSVPLFAQAASPWNWLTLAVIAVTLVRAHWARGDQIALIEALDRNRVLRRQAE